MFASLVAGHMPVVNQSTILQSGEGAGHDLLAPVIVQHLLAQSTRMSVQQAGEDFFFQVFIDVHGYLFIGLNRTLASANY
jgi:hypothetical protein